MDTQHIVKLAVYIHQQWILPKKVSINQIEGAGALFWATLSFCHFRNKSLINTTDQNPRWIGKVELKLKQSSSNKTRNKAQLGYRIWSPDEVDDSCKKYQLTSNDHMILELGELDCPLTLDQIAMFYYLLSEYDQIDWNSPTISINQECLGVYQEHLVSQGERILEMIQKKIPDTIQMKVDSVPLQSTTPPLSSDNESNLSSPTSVSPIPPTPLSSPSSLPPSPPPAVSPKSSSPIAASPSSLPPSPPPAVSPKSSSPIATTPQPSPSPQDPISTPTSTSTNVPNIDTDNDDEIMPRNPSTKVRVIYKKNDIDTTNDSPVARRPSTSDRETKLQVKTKKSTIQLNSVVAGRRPGKDTVSEKKKSKNKPPQTKDTSGGPKKNPWIAHLQEFRSKHPEMPYREAIQNAKLTYVKKSK